MSMRSWVWLGLVISCSSQGTSAGSAGSDAGGATAANTGGSAPATGGAPGSGGSPTGGANSAGASSASGGSAMGGAATSTLRIWYDGESSGVPFSAGSANVSGGSSAVETATDPHAGSACMSVSLNASGGWAHLGWQPDKSGTSYDLSADAAIEFWIKSAAGPITGLELEMHGPNGGCPWVHLADYLSGGVTTTWQKASIPLTAFQIDRTRIQTFDFWLTTGSAAFFVDDGRW